MLRTLKKRLKSWRRRRAVKAIVSRHSPQHPCKVVVGSGGIAQSDWVPTDVDVLNLLEPKDWQFYFEPESVGAIVAEHVWEHLTLEQGSQAANLCWRYLRPGGYLRIAVPDGLHRNTEYIDWVKPGGTGAGADDHKVLYTYRTGIEMLESAGFTQVTCLEYFDEQGQFHNEPWNPEDGMIRRSMRFDQRNQTGQLAYTSLIIDAHKRAA